MAFCGVNVAKMSIGWLWKMRQCGQVLMSNYNIYEGNRHAVEAPNGSCLCLVGRRRIMRFTI
jgi:hypothetical protein